MTADPRPARRVRDPELLRQLYMQPAAFRRCALDPDHELRASLHHISKHPRDDLPANLLWLCGDGTTGCHGLVEHHDPETMRVLERHLRLHRQDFFLYLTEKYRQLGHDHPSVAADEWLRQLAVMKIAP